MIFDTLHSYKIKRYRNVMKWNRIYKFYNKMLELRCKELKNEVKHLKEIIENERENK